MSKKTMPMISVIMPVYNGEQWLNDSIPSVLNQSFKDWEFIIVNDGSKDNSAKVLNEYAKKDSRIHVFNNTNSGPGESLNFGMKHANGKYFCFLDQDDKYQKNYLQEMFDAIDSENADMALCYGRTFDDTTNSSARIVYPWFESGELPQQKKSEINTCFYPQWTKIIRRDLIEKNDIKFPARYNKLHDVPFHILTLWFAKKIMIVNQELYMHRQHENQITHNLSKISKQGHLISALDIEKYYKQHNLKDKGLMRSALSLIHFRGNFRQNLIKNRLRWTYNFTGTLKRLFYSEHIGERYIKKRILFIKYKKKIRRNGFFTPNIKNCGRCSYFTKNLNVANKEQTVIGHFCSIGKNVRLGHGEHPKDFLSTSPYFYFDLLKWKNKEAKSYNNFFYCEPIVIGNDVWIGDDVLVKNGVKSGNGAIVGACSVVTHDVPPYAIVAGVPARIIRYRFDEKTRKELLKLQWWNLPDEIIKQIPFDDINSAIKFIKQNMKHH